MEDVAYSVGSLLKVGIVGKGIDVFLDHFVAKFILLLH